ncbi:transformation system protein [Campylobacter sp. VTCC 70190]|uniref:transformation system protein n=1 Tax=Campylobacter sp. VTCC 70190 TaxID=3392118 RepID=UPI00398F88A7
MCFGTLFAQDFEEYFKRKQNFIDFSILENPFVNPTFEKLNQIKISAIMFDRVKIGEQWYEKGDRIDEAILSEINAKELKFRYDNLDFVIKLHKNDKISIH